MVLDLTQELGINRYQPNDNELGSHQTKNDSCRTTGEDENNFSIPPKPGPGRTKIQDGKEELDTQMATSITVLNKSFSGD